MHPDDRKVIEALERYLDLDWEARNGMEGKNMTTRQLQRCLIKVHETVQAMKQEAHRLKEQDGRYHPLRAGEVGDALFAWADEIEAIVSPQQEGGAKC